MFDGGKQIGQFSNEKYVTIQRHQCTVWSMKHSTRITISNKLPKCSIVDPIRNIIVYTWEHILSTILLTNFVCYMYKCVLSMDMSMNPFRLCLELDLQFLNCTISQSVILAFQPWLSNPNNTCSESNRLPKFNWMLRV